MDKSLRNNPCKVVEANDSQESCNGSLARALIHYEKHLVVLVLWTIVIGETSAVVVVVTDEYVFGLRVQPACVRNCKIPS